MSSSNGESSNSELAAGTILQNRYRVVRPLAKGGMGAVYEALDLRLDATVAIKETFSTDDQLRKQFEREARMLAHLHHPALPRVSDYFTEGNRAFLVMQFIEGVDLARIMAQQPGPFPLESVVAWADQLLDALIYLHSRDRQVIHRDIKPHNLKLTPQGQIALLDFGLAKAQQRQGGDATSSAAIFGYTKQYAPLEQLQDLATGPQSDIYALGATLYHLLTGVRPPDALTRAAAIVQSRPDPLRPANEVHWAIGPEISSILKRAMAQSPDDRYANASDFRNALRQVGRTGVPGHGDARKDEGLPDEPALVVLSGGLDAEGEESGTAPPSDHKRRRHRTRVVAAAAILLLATTVAVFYRSELRAGETPAANTVRPLADPTQRSGTSIRASKPSRLGPQKNEIGSTNLMVLADSSTTKDASTERITPKSPTAGAAGVSQTSDGELNQSHAATRNQRVALLALRAPNIRFPIPDPQRETASQVATRSATIQQHPGSSVPQSEVLRAAAATEPREAQILRARDGTQIVKLPDGSTRVFRPGERSTRSGNAPK